MLASITPLAEGGRAHRYRSTAVWFVTGAVLGGASFGVVIALLAEVVRVAGLGHASALAIGCVTSLLAAASDSGVGGFHLPTHHRQVNERWLDGFRPWVYGVGFGWQIGSGLATYIKTATVYLVVVVSALTGDPAVAFGIGVLFGLVRGCAVHLGRNVDTPQALSRLHQRLAIWDPRSRNVVVGVTGAAALVFALALSPWMALSVAAGALTVFAWHAARRTATPV